MYTCPNQRKKPERVRQLELPVQTAGKQGPPTKTFRYEGYDCHVWHVEVTDGEFFFAGAYEPGEKHVTTCRMGSTAAEAEEEIREGVDAHLERQRMARRQEAIRKYEAEQAEVQR